MKPTFFVRRGFKCWSVHERDQVTGRTKEAHKVHTRKEARLLMNTLNLETELERARSEPELDRPAIPTESL